MPDRARTDWAASATPELISVSTKPHSLAQRLPLTIPFVVVTMATTYLARRLHIMYESVLRKSKRKWTDLPVNCSVP